MLKHLLAASLLTLTFFSAASAEDLPKGAFRLVPNSVINDNGCLTCNKVGPDAFLEGASYLAPFKKTADQLWFLVPAENGYHRLTTMALYKENLFLEGGRFQRGAVMNGAAHMAKKAEVSGQFWKLIPEKDGYYRLTNANLEKKNQFLEGGKLNPKSSLNAAQMNGKGNVGGQFWKLIPVAVTQ